MATNDNSKVVSLDSYRAALKTLSRDNIQARLNAERNAIRSFDAEILQFVRMEHGLADANKRRDKSVVFEQTLIAMYDWLNDEVERTSGAEKEKTQTLLKECEQLIARHERIKKNITEDLANCRHTDSKHALDPIKIAGFITVTPVTLATLTKTFLTNEQSAIIEAGGIGGALGLLLAFHRQARRAANSRLASRKKARKG